MARFAQHSCSHPGRRSPCGGKSPSGSSRLSTRGRYLTRARVAASSLAPLRACLTDKQQIFGISLATRESMWPPIRLVKRSRRRSFVRPTVRTCDAQSDVWAGGTDRLRGPPDNWRSDGEWSAVSIAYKPYAARGTTENAKRPRPGVLCACVSKQNKKPSCARSTHECSWQAPSPGERSTPSRSPQCDTRVPPERK